jgi:hypothetical protein
MRSTSACSVSSRAPARTLRGMTRSAWSSSPVRGASFRHGRIFGAPMGEPPYRYYAEWEWPDKDAFKSVARSEEFMATGKDAMEMGGKFTVMFADLD